MTEQTTFDLWSQSHRRYNPLTRDWVLVSPHRTQRPWQGQVEALPRESRPRYDADCYLCPGNARSGGLRNPAYPGTYVFDNDFPALQTGLPERALDGRLLRAEAEAGACRVICYSPRHDMTMAGMSRAEIRSVVDTWTEQYVELGALAHVSCVQIFENSGAMMGASNPHPHGQVWASASVTNELRRELDAQEEYRSLHSSCLLCDYAALESARRDRIVCENEHFIVVVPFWAVWPFETMVLGRRHARGLDDLSLAERDGLAEVLGDVTARYDALFGVPFPYTMGLHQRPTDGGEHSAHHLHAHFYPPLLRSATVRKFMVGFELLGTPQRDITPESAAGRLRDVRTVR